MSLFDFSSIKNHPHRSGFDLSKQMPFTAKAGELLPVYAAFTLPGDKFELKHMHMTRTQPVNTAAFARIREYFDWYYVPLRLINKNIGQALAQMRDNPVQAESLLSSRSITLDLPYLRMFEPGTGQSIASILLHTFQSGKFLTNAFGFRLASLSIKLLQYLGYGNILDAQSAETFASHLPSSMSASKNMGYSTNNDFSLIGNPSMNFNVNLLFPLAYQKIYADHFRFTQWERNEPYTYNCDYYSGGSLLFGLTSITADDFWQDNNLFTLRYCNWPKDMFMGIMPDQQLGDVSTVGTDPAAVSSIIPLSGTYTLVPESGGNVPNFPFDINDPQVSAQGTTPRVISLGTTGIPVNATAQNIEIGVDSQRIGSQFTIIQLRIAEALQKWKEVSQCADQDYRSQILAHFGVKLSQALSDHCMYIGGSASNLNINEVENTALSDSPALLKGKGVGTSQSSHSFSCDEHGVLMCIYHVQPLLNYTITGQHPNLLMTNAADYPIPEFDQIGLQSIPVSVFANTPNYDFLSTVFPMGYLPRYYSFKMNYDTVLGAFNTTLKDWIVTLDPDYLSSWFNNSITTGTSSVINYNFFKVNPSILDSIFAVKADSTIDTDQFLVNSYFDVKVTRNLDYDGMPY